MSAASDGLAEQRRLEALVASGLLDSPREAIFDDLARVAAAVAGVPTSLVTLVDAERQWFKAARNFELEETSRDISFCAHTIEQPGILVIEDATLDERFADNPLVTGPPGIRFYAGAPIIMPGGEALGTVCVIDTVPREIDLDQRDALRALARQAVREIGLRRALNEMAATVHGQHAVLAAGNGTVGEAALDHAMDGVLTLDAEGRITRLNRAAEGLIGAATNRRLCELLREADRFATAWDDGELADRRTEWTLLTGRPVEVTLTAVPVPEGAVHTAFLRDLTERRRLESRLRHLAHHDPLTGLLNRARFEEELEARAAEVERYGGDATVLLLDLDGFKALNDTHGHQAGDRALVLVSDALRSRLRDTDILARLGGDELAALLPHTGTEAALAVAQGLVDAVRSIPPGPLPGLSASVGVAPLGADARAALAAADIAMYTAKRSGGDRRALAPAAPPPPE